MYEFTIYNKKLNEENIIFGYSAKDAFRRYPEYNNGDWVVVFSEYID